MKNYSSKIKSEKIATKAFNYLLKRIEHVTGIIPLICFAKYEDYYDDQANEKQLKFKLKMLSQLSKFKLSILSTIVSLNFF